MATVSERKEEQTNLANGELYPLACHIMLMLARQAVTVPCALLGLAGGAAYFGNLDTDPLKPIWVCTMIFTPK